MKSSQEDTIKVPDNTITSVNRSRKKRRFQHFRKRFTSQKMMTNNSHCLELQEYPKIPGVTEGKLFLRLKRFRSVIFSCGVQNKFSELIRLVARA